MIRLAHPIDPRNGMALDLSCPVIVCDVCGRFIDKDQPGNLLYRDGDPAQYHVHKVCDGALTHELPFSRDISEWLDQLARNYAGPLQKPRGVGIALASGYSCRVTEWHLDGES